MQFTDEWLVPPLEPMLPADGLAAIRQEVAAPGSLWETAVQRKLITDDQVLSAIATRFRFPVANMSRMDPRAVQTVPEQLARRYNVVPVGQTDSYLEIATASPFDLDAEKALAFATGREVRMLLASPGMIRYQLDEIYRGGDEVVSRLLEGMGGALEVKELTDDEDDGAASAEEASQRPIIRLVDMMLADGVASRASDIHVEPIEGGGARRGERHPRGADRRRGGRALPHRRRAAPGDEGAQERGAAPHLPDQDHVGARYRRPPATAGRARPHLHRRRPHRPSRLHPPGLAG